MRRSELGLCFCKLCDLFIFIFHFFHCIYMFSLSSFIDSVVFPLLSFAFMVEMLKVCWMVLLIHLTPAVRGVLVMP